MKASLEGQGLGLPIYNSLASLRKGDGSLQTMPYLVITDYIANAPRKHGSGGYKTTTELVQIDVYQDTRDRRHGLVRSVERALKGIELPTAPEHVYRVEIQSTVTAPDPDPDVDRKTITVAVRRVY